MSPVNLKNKIGNINLQIVLLTIFIFALFLGGYVYQSYKNENNILLRQLTKAQKENNEYTIKLNETVKSIEPLRNEIQILRRVVLNNVKKERDKETVQSFDLNNDREENFPVSQKSGGNKNSRNTAKTKYKIPDPQNNLSRIKDYLKNMEEQNVSLKDKLKELNGLLDIKEKEILKLSDENLVFKKELEKTVKIQSELESELDANSNSRNLLKSQLSLKESETSNLNAVKSNLENQVNTLNDKLSVLTNANVDMEKQVLRYQQERVSLETELNKIKEETLKQAALNETYNKKVSELTQALITKEKDDLHIAEELNQLKKSKSDLESELKAINLTKANNEYQVNQLNTRISELNSAYDSIRNTVSQLSNLLAKKESEAIDKQKELYALEESLDKAYQEKESLILSLREKEKNISDLNGRLSRMESQAASLQTELTLAKNHQKNTIKKLSEVTSINDSLQDRLRDISDGLEPVFEADPDQRKADELRKRVEVKLDLDDEDEELNARKADEKEDEVE